MMNIDTKPRNRIKKIFLDGIMHLGDVITAASVIPVLKEQNSILIVKSTTW